jgi:replicative DNA helicase
MPQVLRALPDPAAFYLVANREIYCAMVDLHRQCLPIDTVRGSKTRDT